MADTKATQMTWFYAAVMHTPDHTAVHRAAYDGATLVTVDPQEMPLTDVSPSHLFDYVTQVLHGLNTKPAIDAATFTRVSADYAAVNAQEQAGVQAEEKATA